MRINFFIFSIIFAILYWIIESTIHYFVFDHGLFEIIPSDENELWMRSLVCGLVIVIGFLAERVMLYKARLQAEKLRTLKATINTVQDMVGNSLNSLQLICIALESGEVPDKKQVQMIQKMVTKSADNMKKLAEISEVIEVEKASGLLTLYTSKFK